MPISLADLEHLFQLMGTYNIAIAELGEGIKFVKAPDTAPTLQPHEGNEALGPKSIHDDPMLYADGVVPGFTQ